MVWLNYEFAWGGRYTHHYTTQSLNGCDILEHELQPIRFQGQYYDPETSLHYNRFRYYDSDVGMFIQRDPIGLLGGFNTFQYAPNPIEWVDPWGLSCTTNGLLEPRKLPSNPNDIPSQFPTIPMVKTVKNDGKIHYDFEYNGNKYTIEFHPDHKDPNEHFDGDHYHIKKIANQVIPPKTKPNKFRLKNTDPNTPAVKGGGTFAAGDMYPDDLRY